MRTHPPLLPSNLPEEPLKRALDAVRQQASWCPTVNAIPHYELLTLLNIGIRAYLSNARTEPDKTPTAKPTARKKPKGPAKQPSKRTLVLQRDKYTCYLCNKQIRRGEESIDHVVPKVKGGGNGMDNLRAAHKNCNFQKGDLSLEEYRRLYPSSNQHSKHNFAEEAA